VNIEVSDDNVVTVKGKLGELHQQIDPGITVKVDNGEITLERQSEDKQYRSLHGLYRALISNMVTGVSEGFKLVLELVGVGYKAQAKGQVLELSLGFSHTVYIQLPDEVKVETLTERGKSPQITLTSHDKQLVGQVAAKIRSLRKPEPYKGKGVRFQGEVLRRKAGKAAAEK
jgi:large subunit ribosomal protein L6